MAVGGSLAVDLATVSGRKSQDNQAFVFDFADGPVVGNPVTPQPPLSRRCLSQLARMLRRKDTAAERAKNASLSLAVQSVASFCAATVY